MLTKQPNVLSSLEKNWLPISVSKQDMSCCENPALNLSDLSLVICKMGIIIPTSVILRPN